ncbi:retinol dehydrogenase 12-like [Euwallacea fornicatus]|uniref:retinol dehydrogenase 12-like n=1 Tax=Euwallacea fornicatus TaxID=995702 RepID=UPI00338F6598
MHVGWLIVVCMAMVAFINKLICFWCRSKVCLVGKTALITGAASGMGMQTALALAAKGCRIIVADLVNIEEAVKKIKSITHNPHIIGKSVDLGSLKSVRQFAKNILETEPKLDLLMCNAGVGNYRIRIETVDGLEKTMQVNYFSHFLLTHLLLGLLKKSSPSRIVFTSSEAAFLSSFKVDELNPNEEYFQKILTAFNGGVYSNSKLAVTAAVRSFAKRIDGTGVKIYAVHPGVVKTSFISNTISKDKNYLLGILFMSYLYIFGKTPEEGAQTLIHVAHSDEVENDSGKSFLEGMRIPDLPQLTNRFCEDIWQATIKILKMESHEIAC